MESLTRPGGAPLAAVVLAAGSSRRMGRDKLALPWREATVLDAVARAARALPVAVLVGGGRDFPGIARVESPRSSLGQAHSLRAGLAALPGGLAGAMVLLGDMPLVTPELVLELARAFRPGRFLVPVHAGRRGNPVVIPANWFGKVMELSGDVGARALFTAPGAPVDYREVSDPAVIADLDTPEDYSRLTNQP